MSETASRSFWVKVPDHNAYDKAVFDQRIAPHLNTLGMSTFVPGMAKLVEIETDGQKRRTEQEATQTEFGLIVTATNTDMIEVYQTLNLLAPVLKALYSLEAIETRATYQPDHSVNFVRKIRTSAETES